MRTVAIRTEEGERGYRHDNRRADALHVLRVSRHNAVQQKIAQDVGTDLVKRAVVALRAAALALDLRGEQRFALCGHSSMDRVSFDRGQQRVQPRHSVGFRLDEDSPAAHGVLVPRRQRGRQFLIDEASKFPAERTDREGFCEVSHLLDKPRCNLRFEGRKFIHDDRRVPLGHARVGERIPDRRIPVHERLSTVHQHPGLVLGDPEGCGELKPHRALDQLPRSSAVARDVIERLEPELLDASQPLRREHCLHRRDLKHEFHSVGLRRHPSDYLVVLAVLTVVDEVLVGVCGAR